MSDFTHKCHEYHSACETAVFFCGFIKSKEITHDVMMKHDDVMMKPQKKFQPETVMCLCRTGLLIISGETVFALITRTSVIVL